MTTEHTPGPWTRTIYCIQSRGETIAIVEPDMQHTDADVNLIHAAPDLLAALELCLATMAVVSPEGAIAVLGAHDAIAKARGA